MNDPNLLIVFLTLILFLVGLLSFRLYQRIKLLKQRTRKLEEEISQKADAIAQVIAELRTTQLKLFETGKISAVASLSAGILHQISQQIGRAHV